jgi:hypothetical protein
VLTYCVRPWAPSLRVFALDKVFAQVALEPLMTGCTAFFHNAYRSSPIDSPHPARSDYGDVGGLMIAAHPHDCRPGDPVERDQRQLWTRS